MPDLDLDGECGLCSAYVLYGIDGGNFCTSCLRPYCGGCYVWHNVFGQHVNGEYIDDGEPSVVMEGYKRNSEMTRHITAAGGTPG